MDQNQDLRERGEDHQPPLQEAVPLLRQGYGQGHRRLHDLVYDEGWRERIYEEHYKTFINALIKFNKKEILQSIFTTMDEHFEKLKNSDREDERAYWPGMKANEYFQVN